MSLQCCYFAEVLPGLLNLLAAALFGLAILREVALQYSQAVLLILNKPLEILYFARHANNYKMDANMQQIMMEAEHQYNSRVAAHLQSQFQPPSGSPHLDSIVYYELPDTPRKRKKIFDPRYKYAQHNRHLTRLQSNEPLRAASIDF